MTRNKIILVATVIVALVAGWYFGSPRWTLWQMGQAAEARDSDRLARYIDFPTLRETTKSQMKAQMMARAEQQGSQDSFGALGAMIGLAMIDPMVDGLVTPETMRAAFANAPDKAEGRPAGSQARGATGGQGNGAGAASGGAKAGPLGIDTENAEIVHEGLNEFRVRKKDAQNEAGDLIFRRHGLGWKLEEVRLPPDLPGGF